MVRNLITKTFVPLILPQSYPLVGVLCAHCLSLGRLQKLLQTTPFNGNSYGKYLSVLLGLKKIPHTGGKTSLD